MSTTQATSNILFLSVSLAGGGAERVASDLSFFFEGSHDIALFDTRKDYAFDGREHMLDIPLHERLPRHEKLARMLAGLARLASLKRSLAPKVCLSFMTFPNLFNALTRGRERVVLSVHTNESLGLKGPFKPIVRALGSLAYPRADRIIAVSEGIRRDLIDFYGLDEDKVVTIWNPVPLEKLEARRREPLDDAHLLDFIDDDTIVTMGRLYEPKGQWHLLRSFAHARALRPGTKLMLIGKGPLEDYLVGMAEELGLKVAREPRDASETADCDVVFAGFQSNPFPLLGKARVFAFPSLWEGLPMALVEALACECAVIASDCVSGPREIMAPGTSPSTPARVEERPCGWLMPPLDGVKREARAPLTEVELAWSQAMRTLLDAPDASADMARAGAQRALDFSIDRIGAQWRACVDG